MKRVVVTGMGAVSSIGDNIPEILESLRSGKPGISASAEMAEHGFRSQVEGRPQMNPFELYDRRALRFMAMGSAWNFAAMLEAIADSGLEDDQYRHNPRYGIIMGSGGPSTSATVDAADITRKNGSPKRVGPLVVPKTMSSTASATLAVAFNIQGVNNTVSAACATGPLCIRSACLEIMLGYQDVVFAGASEEVTWTLSNAFDALGAMSSNYNDEPARASRAYDKDRDGFVISGGAGVLVLEEYEHAVARGAQIYAEIVGLGHNSDGADMVAPTGEGARRCMQMALKMIPDWDGHVDYINPHATSTPAGDIIELQAIASVLGLAHDQTKIAGTKCLTGHSLGAAGVHEAIYTLLMMQHGFVSPNINVDNLDPQILDNQDLVDALVFEDAIDHEINLAFSNSFGFGGTNATLVFQKV